MQLCLDLYSFLTSPTFYLEVGGIKKERDVVERRSFLTGLPVISGVGRLWVLQEWQAMLSVFCLTSQRKHLAGGGGEFGDLLVWWGLAVFNLQVSSWNTHLTNKRGSWVKICQALLWKAGLWSSQAVGLCTERRDSPWDPQAQELLVPSLVVDGSQSLLAECGWNVLVLVVCELTHKIREAFSVSGGSETCGIV